MQNRNSIFPYPVIRPTSSDYKTTVFKVRLNIEKEGHDILFLFNYSVTNSEIRLMIEKGEADIISIIECPQTFFRMMVVSESLDLPEITEINEKFLNGLITIASFIVLKKDSLLSSNDFSEVYAGIPIALPYGAIIGKGNFYSFTLEKKNDELVLKPSIFSIVRKPKSKDKTFHVNLTKKKIEIQLSDDMFFLYKGSVNDPKMNSLFTSMVIFPALVYVLSEIENTPPDERSQDFEDCEWYQILQTFFKEYLKEDINAQSFSRGKYNVIELAQKVLDNPVFHSVGALKKIIKEEL